ncbi:MAG: ATP-binding protein, partial [Myxococcota bacterium]
SGELSPTLADANQQIRDLIDMLERLLPESIRIRTELEPRIWPLETDSARLEQALLNLVLNAGDAMPNGGELTLATRNVTLDDEEAARIEGLQAGQHVRIQVSDSGRGMDESTASRAFEPFFTTKETGEGSGLGLATTYGSIRQSGGTIQVSSDEGRGSTFTVLLPRAVDPSAAVEERAPSPGRGQGETVLIVEDQPTLRQLLQRALEGQGYRVLLAADGIDAVELAGQQRDPVDLVITDMVMPRLGGGATVARLREAHPDLKAIFISGYAGGAPTTATLRTSGLPSSRSPSG